MCCELYKYGQAENIHWKKGEPFLPSFLDIITMMDGGHIGNADFLAYEDGVYARSSIQCTLLLTRTSCLAFRIEQKG